MKIFGREPTLYITLISSIVLFVGTFGLNWINGEQAGLIVAAISAIFGALNAALVRPVAPAAFTAAIAALLALATAYGFHLTAEQVAGINALVVPVLALIFRNQVSPTESPVSSS